MTQEEQAIRADERRKCVEEIRVRTQTWPDLQDRGLTGMRIAANIIERGLSESNQKEQVK